MITFGMDTAGRTVSVALMRDEQLLYECYQDAGLTHSETLMPLVDQAFKVTNLTPQDVNLWGVCAGPGSFTGLRIGLLHRRGLCAGLHSGGAGPQLRGRGHGGERAGRPPRPGILGGL